MAAFPPSLKILIDTSEDQASAVLRSPMERGVPKYRRFASDVLVQVPITVLFFNQQQAADFDTWFITEINAGADAFDWTDPRTGVLVQAHILDGKLGPIVPLRDSYHLSRRSMTLEFMRSAI